MEPLALSPQQIQEHVRVDVGQGVILNAVQTLRQELVMLLDETVEKRLGGGLTIRSSFDVKPGIYSIRLVVRDAEGQLMTAQNGAVDIPY